MKRNMLECAAAIAATALCAVALHGCATATAEEPPTKDYDTEFAFVTDWAAEEGPVGFSKVAQEQEARAEQQPEQEPEPEQEWTEPTYYEPVYYESGGGNDYGNPFESAGVVYQDGTRYTWYTGPSSYDDDLTVDSEGFYRDSEGYYVVASSDHDYGTVVDTPWGEGRVYDTGCASGTLDMYTDF